MNRTFGLALATVAAAAVLLTGCDKTLDANKGETEIAKTVRIQAGTNVQSVKCPSDVKIEKGGKFTCVVTAKDGTKGDVQVVQKDDKGNVRFDAPFIHVDEAEAAIVEQINAQVKNAKNVAVDCPDIIIGKPGAPFVCKGSATGETFVVNAVQTDGTGKFTFKTATK